MDPVPDDPPFRGAWLLAAGRWSWYGANDLFPVIADLLAAGRSVALVPESYRGGLRQMEIGGLVFLVVDR